MRASPPGLAFSVNHMFPSGPGVINQGARSALSPSLYSVISPLFVMRPILPGLADSVNQSAPSVPSAMPVGWEPLVRPSLYSVI